MNIECTPTKSRKRSGPSGVYAHPQTAHPYSSTVPSADILAQEVAQSNVRRTELDDLERFAPQSPRLKRLREHILTAPVVSKDISCRPSVFHMGYIGSSFEHDSNEQCVRSYIETMTTAGLRYGFKVHVGYDPTEDSRSDRRWMAELVAEAGNCVFFPFPQHLPGMKNWPEDCGSFTDSGGSTNLPRIRSGIFDDQAPVAIFCARINRHLVRNGKTPVEFSRDISYEDLKRHYRHLYFDILGCPGNTLSHLSHIARTLSAGLKNTRTDLCYLEGGNVLPGKRADGSRFAVVGVDSLVATRVILQSERKILGELSDQQIKQLMAIDLGLADANDVIIVEQPHAFHLDMKVLLIGNGTVVVNDAMAAYEKERQWAESPKLLRAANPLDVTYHKRRCSELERTHTLRTAERAKMFEDATAADLTAQGFQVVRKAMVFPTFEMNFCNGELGTATDGTRFFITNGGFKIVQQAMRFFFHDFGIEVIFVPREASIYSLRNHGGAGCRVKVQGS